MHRSFIIPKTGNNRHHPAQRRFRRVHTLNPIREEKNTTKSMMGKGTFSDMIRANLPIEKQIRSGFSGEKHAVLKLPNGKLGRASFMGPGTEIIKRLKRGDKGRTPADRVAKAHDIRYSLAEDIKDIRNADKKMIQTLKSFRRRGIDKRFNTDVEMRAIQAKVIGENLGVIKRTAFSGPLPNPQTSGDRTLLKSNLTKLEQAGFGMTPADTLKMKILKGMVKGKGKFLKPTPAMLLKLKTMKGQGLIINKIIPAMMRELKIRNVVPKAVLKKVISKVVKKLNLGNMTSELAKVILPILTVSKSKQLGISGKGRGKNLLPLLKKTLDVVLKKVLLMGGSGLKLAGSGFWSSFKKGFLSVFKPGAKIIAAAATALGQPEIGIPLGLASELL